MAIADQFETHQAGLESPCINAVAVTPHNTNLLPFRTRALYIGGAGSGNLTVEFVDGTQVAFAGITGCTLLPIRVIRVRATGTDVTGIVALR